MEQDSQVARPAEPPRISEKSPAADPQPSSSSGQSLKSEPERGDFVPQPSSSTSPAAGEAPKPEEEKRDKHKSPSSAKREDVRSYANGSLQPPTGGKPLMAALTKKLSKPRGRPKRKALVKMYQSEISDNKLGIKLCIKKSETPPAIKQKSSRKRSRKSKARRASDSDDSDYEKRRRKELIKQRANNNTDKAKEEAEFVEPEEQSCWGATLPKNVLHTIFLFAVQEEGCLPTLINLGRVCSLWHEVSLNAALWHTLDLSAWVKDRFKTELKLKWFIDNRFRGCQDVNVSNWKVTNVQCVLEKMVDTCPNLVGMTLAGWKFLLCDHLSYIVENFRKLERLDLSSINLEANANKTAVGFTSLCNAIQGLNGRLTHLLLAHNKLGALPQIITALATHCPNLVLLDLSNICTLAMSHAILHIEKLQHGCPKLKVLRITNAQITLSQIGLQEQMESPGFPDLEELSVASLAESRLINDEFVQRILKSSTKLKLLDVRGCARLTHDSLIRLPAWDLKHLFLSGCSVTRDYGSGLELIASKWAHSLTEIDLAWANVQGPLDNALKALAEKKTESPLSHLNLCGSSVSLEAVKEILSNCPILSSINLSSCRGLPRGFKRLLQGPTEITELRENLGAPLQVVKKEESTLD
ncbi:F-box/LRR-repeat protein 6 [Phlebotomus argentipes]|uniref:F-box/LRR-repeat protein 6 n=1 Tax=Phlebotomus argentipes TaxID=94469 RepID=UPI0028936DA4|nr:F-box/LRR-repeat protein 6 [Phlebotomus argentipes]